MTVAEQISGEINELLPSVKSGSLRFFGEWFGRPYDNQHEIIAASANENVLTISFDGDETLSVWNPVGFALGEKEFAIEKASRVLWKWFYYGREKIAENERFQDFEVVGDTIRTKHNIEWYEPDFQPILTEPAVRIYSYSDNPVLKST